MNRMVLRRDLLINFLRSKLPAEFNFADRLRRETFDSSTRSSRIRVMGDPTMYCEVLYAGLSENDQEDTAGTTVLDTDTFRVNLWYYYHDWSEYTQSSQAAFDNILFNQHTGIITGLREVETLNPGAYSPGIPLSLTGIETSVISLDESGVELAHFLTFTITIR